MAALSKISIQMRLIVPITVIILGISLFQVLYFPRVYADRAEQSLRDKAHAVAALTAGGVEPALEFGDTFMGERVLDLAAQDAEFRFAEVFDENGLLFVTSGSDGSGEAPEAVGPATTTRREGELFVVVSPILTGDEVRGSVVMGFSVADIETENTANRENTFLLGAVVLVLGLTIAIWAGTYVRRRIRALEDIAADVQAGSLQIRATSGEILASAQQQERGATEQSASVDETRRTLESLLASSEQVAEMAGAVLDNAQSTQRSNELVADSIGKLAEHTERIGEILEVIRGIANKSELLALNAALEGTKAGEAGRGFSLVATQMQRLAENVMGSVGDIKELTGDIRSATNATVLSTEEGTKLAAGTTTSARQISMIIQQQQSGSRQVSLAMEDVAKIALETAAGSRQAVSAIEQLTELSDVLEQMVQRFRDREGA